MWCFYHEIVFSIARGCNIWLLIGGGGGGSILVKKSHALDQCLKKKARLEGRKRKKYHAFTHVLRKILMRERVKKHHPCRTSPTASLKWKDRPPRKAENINLRSNANIPITRNSVNPKFWQTLAYVSFGLPRRRMWRKCCFNLTFKRTIPRQAI